MDRNLGSFDPLLIAVVFIAFIIQQHSPRIEGVGVAGAPVPVSVSRSGTCNRTSLFLDLLTAPTAAVSNKMDCDVLIHFVDSPRMPPLEGCAPMWTSIMRQRLAGKVNTSGIGLSFSSNGVNNITKAPVLQKQLAELISNNQRPLIAVLLYSNDSHLRDLFPVVARSELEVMYLFVPLAVFPNRTRALESTKPALELIGQRVSLADNAYLFTYHYANDLRPTSGKNPRNISILIQEAYSIRGTMVTHTLSTKPDTDSMGLGILGLPHGMFRTNLLQRRMDFEGATVIASGHEDHEYVYSTKFKDGSDEFESGFEVSVYRYLRDALNFTEKSIRSNGYIKPGPNGALEGYANQLSRGLADIGIGSTEFIPYRVQGPDAIAMLIPTTKTIQSAFFTQPPPSAVRNIFIKTFTPSVWSSLFGIWILIIESLKLITLAHQNLQLFYERDELVAKDVLMWATGAVCQQGWYVAPDSICVKIVFFFGSLTGLILYIAYSAALVSILSVNVNPVTEFTDLIAYGFDIFSDYRIPTTNLTLTSMEQNNELPRANHERPVVIDEKIDALIRSRLAIVAPPDSFYPIASANYSELFVCTNFDSVRVTRSTIKMSPCVKKGSPLKGYFNYVLLSMKERGTLTRLYEVYLKESCVQCLEKSAVYHANLNLGDVFTAFVVLGLGYLVSGTLGVIEVLHFRIVTARNVKV